MQRTIRQLVLATSSVVVLSALVAAPAFATTMTTEPASPVAATTAVLTGVVTTGGVATAWQFQYGTTPSYGQNTPLQQIPAGKGNVSVSWMVQGLSPSTTYHFRLVGITGIGTYTSPLNVAFGRDLTFTTNSTGRMGLVRHRLIVTNGFVSIPLRCMSGVTCHGRFTISTLGRIHNTNTFANVLCATTFFTIGAQRTNRIRVRVRSGCLTVLRGSPHRRVIAKLTSNPRTGQKALIARVTLVLG
jgi:hypothetical protein